MSLRPLSLHLRHVGLHGSNVLVVNRVFYVGESVPEDGSTDTLHAGVDRSGPILFNFGNHRKLVRG